MQLNEFINKKINTKVDYDGVYGAQCVDLFRQYCKDVLNIKEHTGSVDGARELFENYERLPLEIKYFSRVLAPVCGDVVVYGATKTNKYGHVAIYLADYDIDNILIFEQDGFKQDGAKMSIRAKTNILGYLHRREDD